MKLRHVIAGIGLTAASYGAAALGVVTMRGAGRPDGPWFRALDKPAFQPPNWLFAPVWTVLYGTIAYSGYRVWARPGSAARSRALAWWAAQLVLNAAWTPLFFGAQRPTPALVDIAALDIAAIAYALAAAKVDPRAMHVIVPYLAWIAYATALNASIVARN